MDGTASQLRRLNWLQSFSRENQIRVGSTALILAGLAFPWYSDSFHPLLASEMMANIQAGGFQNEVIRIGMTYFTHWFSALILLFPISLILYGGVNGLIGLQVIKKQSRWSRLPWMLAMILYFGLLPFWTPAMVIYFRTGVWLATAGFVLASITDLQTWLRTRFERSTNEKLRTAGRCLRGVGGAVLLGPAVGSFIFLDLYVALNHWFAFIKLSYEALVAGMMISSMLGVSGGILVGTACGLALSKRPRWATVILWMISGLSGTGLMLLVLIQFYPDIMGYRLYLVSSRYLFLGVGALTSAVIAWFADGLLKKDGRLAGHTQFEIAGYLANLICMPGVVWLLIRSTGY